MRWRRMATEGDPRHPALPRLSPAAQLDPAWRPLRGPGAAWWRPGVAARQRRRQGRALRLRCDRAARRCQRCCARCWGRPHPHGRPLRAQRREEASGLAKVRRPVTARPSSATSAWSHRSRASREELGIRHQDRGWWRCEQLRMTRTRRQRWRWRGWPPSDLQQSRRRRRRSQCQHLLRYPRSRQCQHTLRRPLSPAGPGTHSPPWPWPSSRVGRTRRASPGHSLAA